MSDLDNLARKHHAYVPSDDRGFRREARILQSIWREGQGYEAGEHDDQHLGSRLPMPWAEETLGNFLSDTIRHVVRNEVSNPSKNRGKIYGRPRL